MCACNISQHMALWLRDLLVLRNLNIFNSNLLSGRMSRFMEYFFYYLVTAWMTTSSTYCVWWENIQTLPLTWLWRNCWVNSVHSYEKKWHQTSLLQETWSWSMICDKLRLWVLCTHWWTPQFSDYKNTNFNQFWLPTAVLQGLGYSVTGTSRTVAPLLFPTTSDRLWLLSALFNCFHLFLAISNDFWLFLIWCHFSQLWPTPDHFRALRYLELDLFSYCYQQTSWHLIILLQIYFLLFRISCSIKHL